MARPLSSSSKPRKRRHKPRKADTPVPPPQGKEALTKQETAFYLGVSVKQVYILTRDGDLRATYVGGRQSPRYSRRSLDAYLDRGGTPLAVAR